MLSAIRRLFGRGEDEHAKVMRLSSEYLDGELKAGPAEMVERHARGVPAVPGLSEHTAGYRVDARLDDAGGGDAGFQGAPSGGGPERARRVAYQ